MSVHRPSSNRTGKNRGSRTGFKSAAFYDFDGTLADLNLVHAALYILGNLGEWGGRIGYLLGFATRLPMLALAEQRDRYLLNVALFEVFKGISRDRLWTLGEEYCERILLDHLFPRAVEMIEANRAAGIEPVLVTGSPDFIVAPLAAHLRIEAFAANRLVYSRGQATGRLYEPVMAGDAKAAWCAEYAAAHHLDLDACWGYADSHYDLAFLTALGHPVAVNPDRKLMATARARQWPIIRFTEPAKRAQAVLDRETLRMWLGRAIDGAAGN